MSRFDTIGLFWEDIPAARGRTEVVRQMPEIPQTGWRRPSEFPNLAQAAVISLDTEAYDPELLDNGPGWSRGRGHMVGVSIAVPGYSWYFPIRHSIQPEDNLPPENVLAWLRDTLGTNIPKVGANLLYDLGWLAEDGVAVRGELYDVQYAESLLSEDATVNLGDLAQRYLGEGKEEELLYRWSSDFYGGKPTRRDQAKNIHRCPPCIVGPYAEADASLPLRIIEKQYPLLAEQNLLPVYDMERRLIPLTLAMRQTGVRVDLQRAEEVLALLRRRQDGLQVELKEMCGRKININARTELAAAFDKFGLRYPRSKGGGPSFTKEFLTEVDHPVAKLIMGIRKLDKLCGTFLESYILQSHVNGRVHCSFHQLRGDDEGARSGRYSSSDPNLQNIPSRDEILAPLMRSIFVPDIGHVGWRKYDYSQIEYRKLVHFATGKGSDEARQQYISNPKTDYHEWTLDLVAPHAGWDVSTSAQRKLRRKPVKNINFGLVFGMGVDKLARSLGLSLREGRELFNVYHLGVPFVKPTMQAAMQEAAKLGYITTIMGRRSRFDLWEPERGTTDERAPGLPLHQAVRAYGRVQRAYLHKAINRRLQGSAADLMKRAMLLCWEQGVFDDIGVPKLTVHDELDFSDPGGKDEGFREMQHIMETAIPLRIPVIAEGDFGPNWGNLEPLPH